MGVSGAGKTTVGERLAERLHWEFAEGDRLHPPENVAKMQSGHPLTDSDRAPWLAAIAGVIDLWHARGICGVITCSALKRQYRRRIIGDRPWVRLVYLDGPRELIAGRLAAAVISCRRTCLTASSRRLNRRARMRTRLLSLSVSRSTGSSGESLQHCMQHDPYKPR
jgi:carbohydrate kinase (thermoresistant glucokinase family)